MMSNIFAELMIEEAEIGVGVELGGSLPPPTDPTIVHGDGVYLIAVLSQNEYDALESPDSQTLYVIKKDAAE